MGMLNIRNANQYTYVCIHETGIAVQTNITSMFASLTYKQRYLNYDKNSSVIETI